MAIAGHRGRLLSTCCSPTCPARSPPSFAPLYRVFENKYGFDPAYDAFAAHVVVKGSDAVLWKRFDAGVIDGAVNGAGTPGRRPSASVLRFMETGLVRAYASGILGGAVALLGYLLWS